MPEQSTPSDNLADDDLVRRMRSGCAEAFTMLYLRHLEKDRRSEGEGEVAELVSADDVLGDLTRKETVELLRKAVLSLPARYREVVVLCEMQEMDYVEAAAVMGCAVGTVRSRLSRARALLAEKL